MVGTGLAASFGVLIKNAEVLEKIQGITTIVFDKTGTLTAGKPQVKNVINCKQQFKLEGADGDNTILFKILYLAEKSSEHPIAQAICSELKRKMPNLTDDDGDQKLDNFNVVTFKNRNGEGIVAQIQKPNETEPVEVLCGNTKLLDHFNILMRYPELHRNITYMEEEGKTVVTLVIDKIPQLVVALEETHLAKPVANFVVNYLRDSMKMRVCMITGDNKFSALKVAKYLGINPADVTYQAYPETKK